MGYILVEKIGVFLEHSRQRIAAQRPGHRVSPFTDDEGSKTVVLPRSILRKVAKGDTSYMDKFDPVIYDRDSYYMAFKSLGIGYGTRARALVYAPTNILYGEGRPESFRVRTTEGLKRLLTGGSPFTFRLLVAPIRPEDLMSANDITSLIFSLPSVRKYLADNHITPTSIRWKTGVPGIRVRDIEGVSHGELPKAYTASSGTMLYTLMNPMLPNRSVTRMRNQDTRGHKGDLLAVMYRISYSDKKPSYAVEIPQITQVVSDFVASQSEKSRRYHRIRPERGQPGYQSTKPGHGTQWVPLGMVEIPHRGRGAKYKSKRKTLEFSRKTGLVRGQYVQLPSSESFGLRPLLRKTYRVYAYSESAAVGKLKELFSELMRSGDPEARRDFNRWKLAEQQVMPASFISMQLAQLRQSGLSGVQGGKVDDE